MSKTYKLKAFKPGPGHSWEWAIFGLPSEKDPEKTVLWLVGMYHSCDTPESIVDAVYRAIYDHHQVTDEPFALPDRAIIESEPCVVNKYHSWDERRSKVRVPAMKFRVNSFHIEKLS